MKVSIEVEGDPKPEKSQGQAMDEAQEAEVVEEAPEAEAAQDDFEVVDDDEAEPSQEELDEEAMVEAAKRAGEAAAEEDFRAEAERAREEVGDLLGQLAAAEEEAKEAKKKAAEVADRFARLQSDWDSYRRRTEEARAVDKERAAERIVTELLPVLDDMERASAHAVATEGDDEKFMQFVSGVDAVHDKMIAILEKEGVSVIDPVGEPFDPLMHQAVGRFEDHEAYEETVAQVYQRGYALGGKVIRAAMVTVTFGGPKRPAEEAES